MIFLLEPERWQPESKNASFCTVLATILGVMATAGGKLFSLPDCVIDRSSNIPAGRSTTPFFAHESMADGRCSGVNLFWILLKLGIELLSMRIILGKVRIGPSEIRDQRGPPFRTQCQRLSNTSRNRSSAALVKASMFSARSSEPVSNLMARLIGPLIPITLTPAPPP